jgi:hypothetical protein
MCDNNEALEFGTRIKLGSQITHEFNIGCVDELAGQPQRQ